MQCTYRVTIALTFAPFRDSCEVEFRRCRGPRRGLRSRQRGHAQCHQCRKSPPAAPRENGSRPSGGLCSAQRFRPSSFPRDLKHVYQPALRGLTGFFIPGITLIVLAVFRRAHNNDYSPIEVANRIKVPTFLIIGNNDEIFPYKSAYELQSEIPNCKLWVPEDGTHSNLEDLPDYKENISTFLADNGLLKVL